MILFYKLFVYLVAAAGNFKAREWVKGRQNLFQNLRKNINPSDQYIWFHCASAGELEQGKPLIEKLKTTYSNYKIIISFFSPSGYKVGKKYSFADAICYLPVDTKLNAKQFIEIVQPQLVIFVKYEYWYYHIKAAKDNQIPVILVSAIFRKEQVFFKWYGKFYKNMLHLFHWIFVQDQPSLQLLKENDIERSSIAGDTRFDRVMGIASLSSSDPIFHKLYNNKKVLVAGSTWPNDEVLLAEVLHEFEDLHLIIVPHEITTGHINQLQSIFASSMLYSQFSKNSNIEMINQVQMKESSEIDSITNPLQHQFQNTRVLIIDNVGMLSRLYQYATICYIGGGFNKSGIHNTLEAAVWGKPVLFGPNYYKFKEARDLISVKAAISLKNAETMKDELKNLLANKAALENSSQAAKNYVQFNTGVTEKILHFIQENRLLTN